MVVSIVLLVIGTVLTAISFLYKRGEKAPAD
jgi:hypothetical protein